jgi:hypothetical protein
MATENSQEETETSESGTGPRIGDDQVIARIQSATKGQSSPPVLSTSDVAELLPIGGEATRKRLIKLEKENRLQKYKAGRNPVWWPAEEEEGGKVRGADLSLEDIKLSEDDYRELIDPAKIPKDVVRQSALQSLEDYTTTNDWKNLSSSGKTTGTFGFGLFFLILLANDSGLVSMEGWFRNIAMVGILLALLGSIAWSIGAVGDRIKRRSEIYHKVSSSIASARRRLKETVDIWTQ